MDPSSKRDTDWCDLGVTCNGAAADQVCEGDVESWGAPEIGVQQGPHSLAQLM